MVWTEVDMVVVRVEFDKEFFEVKMRKQLRSYYENPEFMLVMLRE